MSDFSGLSLKGKTAIVTGASRGIGAGIATLLAKRGANIVVNYVSENSAKRAEEVAENIRKIGTKATVVQANASNLDEIPKIVDAALKISNSGKIEIFIHNDCNVRGPIFLTQAVVPYVPRGGRIVFISSAGARLGVAGQTVYAATKGADGALVRVWAKEFGQSHGITVICVNPGPVATVPQRYAFLKDMQPLIDSTPAAARVGEVDDIAPLVAFLCSEDARRTTGACLSANTGLYN